MLTGNVPFTSSGNYDPAMKFVAYTELAIFARVALGAITYVLFRPPTHPGASRTTTPTESDADERHHNPISF